MTYLATPQVPALGFILFSEIKLVLVWNYNMNTAAQLVNN